jgi:hypothetical protein
MRSKIASTLAVAVTLLLPLAACTVKKTQEGEMPKVDVKGGQLPEYDVKPAEVQVGSTPVEVTVPTVDVGTEKKTVEVPKVTINPAPEASPTGSPHQ